MKNFLKYALLTLLWGGVAAYIIYAASLSRSVRKAKKVAALRIEVVDSTSQGHLVTAKRVREWISKSGTPTIGTAVDAVDLLGIERMIARNGFVKDVVSYISYDGTLHIDISQRKPLLRLLTDGYDAYVTPEGYVFATPTASALYTPVVTGGYRSPFAPDYTGSARANTDRLKREADDRIAKLERDKFPFYKLERQNDDSISECRKNRPKRKWWLMEGSREFEARARAAKKHREAELRKFRYRDLQIQQQIDNLSARQDDERRQQKKLEKSYEDFMKLLTFVKFVENDGFWRSEVVQITAYTTPGGALEVQLTPRSGRHTVFFGRIERVEEKFDKLLRFYRSGLTSVGWDEYASIDIRYNDQVVCKK